MELFYPDYAVYIQSQIPNITDFKALSKFITQFVKKTEKEVVLLIDEVDKSSNNQLFLSFLGVLRNKYLARNEEEDCTFQSVILSGVHDIKSLKLKIRENDEIKLNSPWNIADDFTVEMSFNSNEIKSMLLDYTSENSVQMDFDLIAERIYYNTSGHPFLVSKLCKNIDEEATAVCPDHDRSNWRVEDVDWAFQWLTREEYSTTNFEDMAKNLERNPELYTAVDRTLFGTGKESATFSILDPVINLGVLYGIFTGREGKIAIHNRIYEQILANYMRSRKYTRDGGYGVDVITNDVLDASNRLDMSQILLKFQEFMKEHYSDRETENMERRSLPSKRTEAVVRLS